MSVLTCPHCLHLIELPPDHSTTAATTDPGAIRHGAGYRPHPTKIYKTPEAARRAQLAYYYEHREEILQRMRDQRQQKRFGSR